MRQELQALREAFVNLELERIVVAARIVPIIITQTERESCAISECIFGAAKRPTLVLRKFLAGDGINRIEVHDGYRVCVIVGPVSRESMRTLASYVARFHCQCIGDLTLYGRIPCIHRW